MVFGRVEQGALRHVADASAQLRRGAPVLPQSLVQRELIASSPGEYHQREQQEWQAAYGPWPSILLCCAETQSFYRSFNQAALACLPLSIPFALDVLPGDQPSLDFSAQSDPSQGPLLSNVIASHWPRSFSVSSETDRRAEYWHSGRP